MLVLVSLLIHVVPCIYWHWFFPNHGTPSNNTHFFNLSCFDMTWLVVWWTSLCTDYWIIKYLLQEIGLPNVNTIVLCKTMRIVVFIFQQPSLIGYSWSMDALWEAGLLLNQVQAKVVSLCQVKAPVSPPTENFWAHLHPCIMGQPWFCWAIISQLACLSGLTVLMTGWALFPGFASDMDQLRTIHLWPASMQMGIHISCYDQQMPLDSSPYFQKVYTRHAF